MGYTTQLRKNALAAVVGAATVAAVVAPASAVEMFTYFGDGSHIGLPSLEVPIEAYPGIPLRSDRLRARRAGKAPPRGTVGYFRGRGITIRVPVQQQVPPGMVSPQPPMPEAVPADDTRGPTANPAGDASVSEDTEAEARHSVQRNASLDFGGLRDLSGYEQSLSR